MGEKGEDKWPKEEKVKGDNKKGKGNDCKHRGQVQEEEEEEEVRKKRVCAVMLSVFSAGN